MKATALALVSFILLSSIPGFAACDDSLADLAVQRKGWGLFSRKYTVEASVVRENADGTTDMQQGKLYFKVRKYVVPFVAATSAIALVAGAKSAAFQYLLGVDAGPAFVASMGKVAVSAPGLVVYGGEAWQAMNNYFRRNSLYFYPTRFDGQPKEKKQTLTAPSSLKDQLIRAVNQSGKSALEVTVDANNNVKGVRAIPGKTSN